MKEKMLILLVAGLATAWLAGSGYALENDWKTVALWHMDELVIDDDPNYVADDDVLFGIDRNRDHDLEVLGPNNPVTPGYDAAGGCLRIDPVAAALPPDPNFVWDYSGRGTFKFQGQIASRDRLDCYIFATGNKQIVVWQRDADTDGKGEIEFSVKTAGDASTHTIYAEMVDSNAWQSVECRYELDGSNNGTMTIVTDVETVNSVFAGAGSIDADADTSVYLGCYGAEVPTRFLGRIDEVKLSKTYPPVTAAASDPLSDELDVTWALWHMDTTFVYPPTLIMTPDDDSANFDARNRDLDLNGASLVAPGYDGTGTCLQFLTTSIADADPDPDVQGPLNLGLWRYTDREATFKYDGWISSDDPAGSEYLFSTYGQIGVRQLSGDIVFYVKTWEEGYDLDSDPNWEGHGDPNYQVYNEISADMVDSDQWQHVTASYELDYFGVGSLTLITDLETVVLKDGNAVGPIAKHVHPLKDFARNRIWAYLGNHMHKASSHFHGRMDEVRISNPPQIACGSWGYYDGDFNKDCYVDKQELGDLAEAWLASTDPANPDWQLGLCDQYFTFNIPHASQSTATVVAGIDGVLSAGEWSDAKKTDLFWPEVLELPHIGSLKYDTCTHDDCGAEYYYKWDETYLYVGIQVYDEDVTHFHGYPYDHATLVLNVSGDGNIASSDCAFYNMYMDYPTYDPCCTNPFDQSQNAVNAVLGAGYTADGWIFEAALKWSDCEGYVPAVGKTIGVGGFILDFDYGGDAVYESHTFLFDYGYGDTQAAVKPMLWHPATLVTSISCGEHGYLTSDKNKDCITNIPEFAIMAADWMKCTDPNPNVTGCDDLL